MSATPTPTPTHLRAPAVELDEDTQQRALREVHAGRVLGREHARATMDQVMAGHVAPVRLAALLAMLHVRGEAVEELAGFAESMRAHAVAVAAPAGAIDTCGTGGDGSNTVNVSTGAAFIAAGAGAAVVKHGNRAVSSRCGSADVVEALGGTLGATPGQALHQLEASGIAFCFAPAFHPAMRHAAPVRGELRLRTAFNLLGPICSPAAVTRQVVGVADERVGRLLVQVLRELGSEHALVVHGSDGLDELTLGGETSVLELRDGAVRSTVVTPRQLGLEPTPAGRIAGADADRNATLLRAAIGGEEGPVLDYLLANAAGALLVAGIAEDLADGVRRARTAVADGSALDRLVRFCEAGAGAVVR